MAMNCETALELLSASLDGELTPDQAALLQAHLDQCPSCRALQTELTGLHAACGEMEALPPAELREQIMANLPPQRTGKVIYWKHWGAMAAAMAIIALAAWRLPHALYDRPAPASQEAGIQSAQLGVEDAPDTGLATDVTGGVDPAQPTVCSIGDTATAKNADVQSADSAEPPAALPLLPADAGANAPAAKRATPAEGAEAAKEESAVTDGYLFTAASGGGSLPQDNAVSPESVAPQMRVALFSAVPDPVYAVDPDDTDLVAEPDPLEGEAPIAALPLETVAQDVRDFSRYSAVVVLEGVQFEGDYPRQRQENGDMWYLLPWSELERLPGTLAEGSTRCDLRLEGDDLTPDAPYVLLIVSGEN